MDKSFGKKLKKKFHERNVAISTNSEEEKLKFFAFGYATQNKAIDMMEVVSKFSF